MITQRVLLFLLLFFSLAFLLPKTSKAIDLQKALTSENSIVVKIQEGIEYFFAFKIENKIQVLDKHAEKRLTMAQGYAEEGNNEMVQNSVHDYLRIKERQNNLLGKIDSGEVLGMATERIIEQQKTMEEIKTRVDEGTKQNVIQVQEQVANQVAKRVVEVNGSEGVDGFLNEVAHVWAPGTGPGGEAGHVWAGGAGHVWATDTGSGGGGAGEVYADGGKITYAPGTGPGQGGGVVIEGGEMKFAAGTSEGGSDQPNTITTEVKTGEDINTGGETNVIESGTQELAP